MLTRIVKMTFKPENISSFERIFKTSSHRIRSFKGCSHVELLQDTRDPCIFFTYSLWDSPEDLEAYRGSDFFKGVWGHTRELFADRPEAWSLDQIRL